MQTQKVHWPALLLMILFGFSVLILWGSALVIGISALPTLFSKNPETNTALNIAASAGLQGLIILAAGAFAFLKVIGHHTADQEEHLPFTYWQIPLAIVIFVTSLLAGHYLQKTDLPAFVFIPALTLIATMAPLWLFLNMGLHDMGLGPRWRAWGIFGLGLTLGPLIMLFLEITLGVMIVFAIIIFFLARNPEFANQLLQFSTQLQSMNNPEEALDLLLPYVLNPATVITVLGYTAVAVPMIEELFKPIGVWLFARDLKTPAAGFAMGILSGAAYALLENLGTTSQAGADWTAIVSARAATGLLHITTTGLMGWAIVSLLNERKYLRFFACFLAAISLHGMWNSAGVSFALYTAAVALGKGDQYQWLAVIGGFVMGSLMILLLFILTASSRFARSSMTTATAMLQETGQS